MKRYSTVSDSSDTSSRMKDSDSVSLASSHRRFSAKKRINSELSEPLTGGGDDEFGGASGDPYFVFRSDLQNKLEVVDDFLTEFLRIVHETVRTVVYILVVYNKHFFVWDGMVHYRLVVLYCIVLYCIVLYCIVLYCIHTLTSHAYKFRCFDLYSHW